MTDLPDENEIEVPIVDEQPVEVVLEGEKGQEETVDEREAALKDMKAQLDEVNRRHEQEKIARMRAEQYAMEQAKAAQYTQADLHQSNLQVVNSGIENMQQTISQAKRALADATAAGDYNAVAEANEVLAWAHTQLNELSSGKRNIERHLQSIQTSEGRVADQQPQYAPPPQPQTPEQQFEGLLSRLTPKSAAWMREHPNAANDLNKLSAAHQAATVLKGITPETPEYFSFIESELGISNGRSNGRKPAMASAPVSSSSPTVGRSGYNGGSTMTLSAAEVEQAMLNEPEMSREKAIEAYARSKAQLIREGKLSA
jgi:Skp family chaperone for outer membrane proteins